MYFKNSFLIIILLLLFSSCTETKYEYVQESFIIKSPKTSWIYYYDDLLLFSINFITNDIIWESSIDGLLGTGNHLYSYLNPGLHVITAKVRDIEKSMSINIAYRDSEEIRNLITGIPFELKLNSGIYYPYLISYEASMLNNFKLSIANTISNNNILNRSIDIPLRDIRIDFNGNIVENNIPTRARSINEKAFFVENTLQNGSPPRLINFSLFHEGELHRIWIDNNNTVNTSALNSLTSIINEVLPQVLSMWNSYENINLNNKLTVLVTDVINQENIACGFFNPYDLFPKDLDYASLNFNPTSNEANIVYLAMPNNILDDSYYFKRLAATFIHELTHIITFSKKTLGKTELWNLNSKREIISIDEGLSHLSENIIGYSISGDNNRIINNFLETTGFYSLFGRNGAGQFDSIGMRGAITLFLSWLFWEKGGYEWDKDGNIIDLGGVSFLQALIESDDIGPENISKVYGVPVEILFQKMLAKINSTRVTGEGNNSILHPKTGEPVNLFTGIEYYNHITDSIESIINPISYNNINYSIHSLLPWSFAFLDPFNIQTGENIILTSERLIGRVFLNLGKYFTSP